MDFHAGDAAEVCNIKVVTDDLSYTVMITRLAASPSAKRPPIAVPRVSQGKWGRLEKPSRRSRETTRLVTKAGHPADPQPGRLTRGACGRRLDSPQRPEGRPGDPQRVRR